MSAESLMPSNRLILCHPLLLPPSIFPSIRVFSSESALLIRWPKYWNFSISPSNEYSGLISFRIDWFDLLAVQGTLKSHLQFHRSKASVFSIQPSVWSNSHISMWLLEGGSDSKESTCNAGDPGLIPGSGRSPGEGNSYSLQNSCLENPMDRGDLVGYSPWVT